MKHSENTTKIEIKRIPPKTFVVGNRAKQAPTNPTLQSKNESFWRWGNNNLFPYALSLLSRQSATHRRILNDKADYISGKGFMYDDNQTKIRELVNFANSDGETLRQVINKTAFDKCLFGNAFIEVVTNAQRSFVSLFHHDATTCRIAKSKTHVILHHDWSQFRSTECRKLPLFPNFERAPDGTERSMIHYKDYEPMFENYGVPPYIAGMNVSAIAYKTDRWNITRLDNSFQLSGIMVLGADMDSEEQAQQLIKTAETKFSGNPGQVMFLVKNDNSKDSSQFIPLNSGNEGDWRDLHDQATADIVVAHSWFRSLSGLDYSSGFSSDRILQEYEVALNTVIIGEQEELMEPIRRVVKEIMGCDDSSLVIVNRPPTKIRQSYMKVWEARRADGLEYDLNDPTQQIFLAQLNSK